MFIRYRFRKQPNDPFLKSSNNIYQVQQTFLLFKYIQYKIYKTKRLYQTKNKSYLIIYSKTIKNRKFINTKILTKQIKQDYITFWDMKKFTFGTRQMNTLLDSTLMEKYQFPSQTLMELAGLAIAQVTNKLLKHKPNAQICILVGPGNNGGDGLVAARHLKMMKYNVDLIMFKKLQGKNNIYHKLCLLNKISSKDIAEFTNQNKQIEKHNFQTHLDKKDLIIDAIFRFPFKGEIRSPYKEFIPSLSKFQYKIFSVDIPSGWDANEGNVHNIFCPKWLISLGMPKKFSQNFKGDHYFGGRFVPESICQQLNIELPEYKDDQLYCKL